MEIEVFYDAQTPDTEDEYGDNKEKLLSSKKSNTKIQRFSMDELQQSPYLSKIKELSLNKEFLVLKEEKDVYQISISANTCDTCEKALKRKAGKCGTCINAKSVGVQVAVPKTKPPVAVCDCIPCDCDPGSLCKDTVFSKPKSLPKKPCPAYEYLRNNPPEPKPPCRANKYVDEEYAALQEAKLNALLQAATDQARPKPPKASEDKTCTDIQTDTKDLQDDKEKVCTTCVCAGEDKSTICTKTGEICPKAAFIKVCSAVCASDKETMCRMTGGICSSAAKVCPSVCATDTSIVCPKTGEVCKDFKDEKPTQESETPLDKEKDSKTDEEKDTVKDADTDEKKKEEDTVKDAEEKKKENPCLELDKLRELMKAEAQKTKALRSLKTTEASREKEIPTLVQKASATIKPASSVDKADKLIETKPSATLSSAVDSEVVLQNYVCDADCSCGEGICPNTGSICPYKKKDAVCSGICSTSESQICRKTNDVCPRRISFEDKLLNSADTICKSVCSKGNQDCKLTQGVCPNKDSTSLQAADGVCPGICSKSDQICQKNKDVCPRKNQDTFLGMENDENIDCVCETSTGKEKEKKTEKELPGSEGEKLEELEPLRGSKSAPASRPKYEVTCPVSGGICYTTGILCPAPGEICPNTGTVCPKSASAPTARSKKDDTKAKEKQTEIIFSEKVPDIPIAKKPKTFKDGDIVKDVVSELCKGVCSTTDKICQKTQGICPRKSSTADVSQGVQEALNKFVCKAVCSTDKEMCKLTGAICPNKDETGSDSQGKEALNKFVCKAVCSTDKDICKLTGAICPNKVETGLDSQGEEALNKFVCKAVCSTDKDICKLTGAICPNKDETGIDSQSKEPLNKFVCKAVCSTDKDICKLTGAICPNKDETGLDSQGKEALNKLVCKAVCSTDKDICKLTGAICPNKDETGLDSQGKVCPSICSTTGDICPNTGVVCASKSQSEVCTGICSSTGDICPNTGVVCKDNESQGEVECVCVKGQLRSLTKDDKSKGKNDDLPCWELERLEELRQREALMKRVLRGSKSLTATTSVDKSTKTTRKDDTKSPESSKGRKQTEIIAGKEDPDIKPEATKKLPVRRVSLDNVEVKTDKAKSKGDETLPETAQISRICSGVCSTTDEICQKSKGVCPRKTNTVSLENVEVKTEKAQSKGDETLPEENQISKVCPGVCSKTDQICQQSKGICPRKSDTATSPEVVQETMQQLICKAVCSTGKDICKLTGAVCPNKGETKECTCETCKCPGKKTETSKQENIIICPATGKVCKDNPNQEGEECICVTSTEVSTSEKDVKVRALTAKREKGGKAENKDDKSKGKEEDDLPCWERERLEELRQREALMKRVLGGTSTTNATPSSGKGTTSVGKSTRTTRRDDTKSPESSKERKQTEIMAGKKDPDIKPKATKNVKVKTEKAQSKGDEALSENDQISKVCTGVCSTTDEICQKVKGICPRKSGTEVVQETMQKLICKAVCSTGKDICKLTGAVCPNKGKGQETNIICPATGKVCKDNQNQAGEECICVTSTEVSTSGQDVKVRALKGKREKDNEKGGKDEDKDDKTKGKEEDLPCWERERLEELRQREALMKRVLGGSKSLTATSATNATPSSGKGTTSAGKSTRTTRRDDTKSPESKERKQTEIIAGKRDRDITPKATKNVRVKTEKTQSKGDKTLLENDQISKVCPGVCSTTDETCLKSKGICPRKSGTDFVQDTMQKLICKAVCSIGKDICKLTGAVCPNKGEGKAQENIICPATGKVCKDNQNQAGVECICVTSTKERALKTKDGKDNEKPGKGGKDNEKPGKGGKDNEEGEKDELDNLPCWEKERLQELKQREKERLAAGLPIKPEPSAARPSKKEDKRVRDKSDRGQKTLGKSDKGISAGKSSEKFKDGTKQSLSKGKITEKSSKAAGTGGRVCPNKRDGVCENICEGVCRSKDGDGKEDEGRGVSGLGSGGKGGSGTGGRTRGLEVAGTKGGPDCICGGKINKDKDLICQADCAEAAKNKTAISETIKTICEAVCAGGAKTTICPCKPDICKGPCSNSEKEDVNLQICPFTGAVCPSKPETQDKSIVCPTTGNVCPRQRKSGESKEVGTNLKGTDICQGTGGICPSKGGGKDVICPGVGGVCPINIKGDVEKKEETAKSKAEVCPATGKICKAVGIQVETSKPKAPICPATGKICKAVGTQVEASKPTTNKGKPVSTNQAGVQTCKPCLPKAGKMVGINADGTVHPTVEAELRIGKSQVLCTICPTQSIGTCPDICPSKQPKAVDKSTTSPDGPGGTKTVDKGVICPSIGKVCQKNVGTMKTPEECPPTCVPKATMTEKPVQIQKKPVEIPQKPVEQLQVKPSEVVKEQKPAITAAIQEPPEYIRPTPRPVQPKEPERKASRPKYEVTCPVTGGICYTTGIICPPPGEICPTTGTVCPSKANASKAAVAVTGKASEVITQQKEITEKASKVVIQQKETTEKENVNMKAISVEKTESSFKKEESSAKEKQNDAKEEDNCNIDVKTGICIKPCNCSKRKQKEGEGKKEETGVNVPCICAEPCTCIKRKQKEGDLEKSEVKKVGTEQKPTKRTDKSKIADPEEGKGKKVTQEAKPCWVLEKEAELAEREKQRKKFGLGPSGSTKVPPKGKALVSKGVSTTKARKETSGVSTTKTRKETTGDKSQKATARARSPGATGKKDKGDKTDQEELKPGDVCPKIGDICPRTDGPCPAASGGICRIDKKESSAEEKENDAKGGVSTSKQKQKEGDLGKSENKKSGTEQKPLKRTDKSRIADSEEGEGEEGTQEAKPCWVLEKEAELAEREKQRKALGLGPSGVSKGVSTTKADKKISGDKSQKGTDRAISPGAADKKDKGNIRGQGELKTDQGELKPDGVCPKTGDIICSRIGGPCPAASGGICRKDKISTSSDEAKDGVSSIEPQAPGENVCPATGNVCLNSADQRGSRSNKSLQVCPGTGDICPKTKDVCPSTSGGICKDYGKGVQAGVDQRAICPFTGGICPRKSNNSSVICPATGSVCTSKSVAFSEEQEKSASQNICPATGTVCVFKVKSKEGNDICPSTREICPKTKGVCIGEICTKILNDAMVGTDTTKGSKEGMVEATKSASQNICPSTGTVCEFRDKSKEGRVEGTKVTSQNICPATGTVCEIRNKTKEVAEGTKSASQDYCPATGTVCQFSDKSKEGNEICPSTREICPKTKGVCIGEICIKKLNDAMVGTDTTEEISLNTEKKKLPPKKNVCTCMLKIPEDFSVICQPCGNWHKLDKLPTVEEMRMLTPEQLESLCPCNPCSCEVCWNKPAPKQPGEDDYEKDVSGALEGDSCSCGIKSDSCTCGSAKQTDGVGDQDCSCLPSNQTTAGSKPGCCCLPNCNCTNCSILAMTKELDSLRKKLLEFTNNGESSQKPQTRSVNNKEPERKDVNSNEKPTSGEIECICKGPNTGKEEGKDKMGKQVGGKTTGGKRQLGKRQLGKRPPGKDGEDDENGKKPCWVLEREAELKERAEQRKRLGMGPPITGRSRSADEGSAPIGNRPFKEPTSRSADEGNAVRPGSAPISKRPFKEPTSRSAGGTAKSSSAKDVNPVHQIDSSPARPTTCPEACPDLFSRKDDSDEIQTNDDSDEIQTKDDSDKIQTRSINIKKGGDDGIDKNDKKPCWVLEREAELAERKAQKMRLGMITNPNMSKSIRGGTKKPTKGKAAASKRDIDEAGASKRDIDEAGASKDGTKDGSSDQGELSCGCPIEQ